MSRRTASSRSFYRRIKRSCVFSHTLIRDLFSCVNEVKVNLIAEALSAYLRINLSGTIDRRNDLQDYKTNPYVLLTSASTMNWEDIDSFAGFLFNSKLYAGLETAFGRVIESEFVPFYPNIESPWIDPPEKIEETTRMQELPIEERARARDISVWREIDKSYTIGNKRFLLTIKSGPHCINDTQVEAMKNTISSHYLEWYTQSRNNNPEINELDIVIGITYGTEKTTNNKENQILIKLLEHGFIDSGDSRGTLYHEEMPQIKVYRVIGINFWSFLGDPENPEESPHIFLEILLGLLSALGHEDVEESMEDLVNRKIQELSVAIQRLSLPRSALPTWVAEKFDANELLWLMSAISTFYDAGFTNTQSQLDLHHSAI